ncbi:MAG: 4-hydroxyphenylpyruvate dioxygenase [Euryarchaeota archaeon]|nr:4-hydroxyphenylpyruvate dioxygenase [Euryarchaeota archaeon]MBJ35761.1 4-hydroxyphenylpyruvate dioxygenase [Euryarchaeota archaeon]|tara:strand:+ start:2376 stop:3464 length:1089 start_codon:yes stop_codon:yes gene_type:complete
MSKDPVPLKAVHHVEFWVGNAKQAAYYYRKAFGFSQIAYSGLETGDREKASYVLEQGRIRMMFSTPLNGNNELAEHIRKHGDGVKDIAFHVDNAKSCYEACIARGAKSAHKPETISDDNGTITKASIFTYGETVHSFISYDNYKGPFLPGFIEQKVEEESVGLKFVDHIVGNVELGKMEHWVNFYADIMGFSQIQAFSDDDISTEYSALMSKVMESDNGRIKFPINEPAEGRKKSQIDEYLEFYEGPGVQHVALLTSDIIKTIKKLKANGVEFLEVPDTYYEDLTERVGVIDEDLEVLRKLKILVDRDDEGYLLQLFTKPVEDRPTVFYEVIQRKGSKGFGIGNFKALFEAIERHQAERGNL